MPSSVIQKYVIFKGCFFIIFTALDSIIFCLWLQVIKREPGSLGARCWSLYGRCYLRHFNELDHELMSRLSKGYKVSVLMSHNESLFLQNASLKRYLFS